VANERNAVKVRSDAPLELLGPLGCGVQTGAGAVMNALQAKAGSSLVVSGGGGVGLSAAMAAVVQGCTKIIVVEPNAGRRKIALQIGATDVIDPSSTKDLPAAIIELTGGGADYAVETSGKTAVAQQIFSSLAVRGELALIAFYGLTATASFRIVGFYRQRPEGPGCNRRRQQAGGIHSPAARPPHGREVSLDRLSNITNSLRSTKAFGGSEYPARPSSRSCA